MEERETRRETPRRTLPPDRRPSFPRSAWECLLRRSASSVRRGDPGGRGASRTAFPRRAWERVKLLLPLQLRSKRGGDQRSVSKKTRTLEKGFRNLKIF